jgi:hypothetical protein
MAKRTLSDGLPEGAFVCVSEAENKDAVCFDTNEIAKLLTKIAAKSATAPISP